MHHYNLVLVPVVDAYDALIGVISSRDIARAIANDPPISLWT
jgi:CBS domain-containing protein